MKKNVYKVIEEVIFPSYGNEKVVLRGTLEECKEFVNRKYSSTELLDYLSDEGVDIKEFIASYLYDPEEKTVILPNGKMTSLEMIGKYSEDCVRDMFTSSNLGYYDFILGEDKTPVVLKYGYAEED